MESFIEKYDNVLSLDTCQTLIDQFEYTKYYNFSKGVDIGLYDKNDFSKKGKLLFKQSYNHPSYSHPNFQPFMSIVDLLFFELPNALEIIRI